MNFAFYPFIVYGNVMVKQIVEIKSYRAIYIEDKNIIRVTVIEVNKHEY